MHYDDDHHHHLYDDHDDNDDELQQPRASQLVSFLQPFKYTLWILVLVSVKVIDDDHHDDYDNCDDNHDDDYEDCDDDHDDEYEDYEHKFEYTLWILDRHCLLRLSS